MFVAKTLSLVLIFTLTFVLALPFNGRIYGGELAAPGQFPYIVSVNLNKLEHRCGASIINSQWVLTAAHCVSSYPTYMFSVVAGSTLLLFGGTQIPINSVIIHPDYNYTIYTNDIALMKIEGEFTFDDSVQTVEIDGAEPNETCTVMGWGDVETGLTISLRFANITTLSDEDCTRLSEGGKYIFDRGSGQICVLGTPGVSTCYGDSGGPLVCHGKVVGVVSYGVGECGGPFPEVYTKVSYYKDWINEVINASNEE